MRSAEYAPPQSSFFKGGRKPHDISGAELIYIKETSLPRTYTSTLKSDSAKADRSNSTSVILKEYENEQNHLG